jgi:hypothetical protein
MHFSHLGGSIKSTLVPWLRGDGRSISFSDQTIPSNTIPQGVGYPNGAMMTIIPYGHGPVQYQLPRGTCSFVQANITATPPVDTRPTIARLEQSLELLKSW